jgi:hypothetical protein
MKKRIELSFKKGRDHAPTHLRVSIPLDAPFAHVTMAGSPGVPGGLQDGSFDCLMEGDVKVSAAMLKDKDDPDRVYLAIRKEKQPPF